MITQPEKVSIIIPVYNVEKYLRVCLDSCIHQTLNDIEIICINDGSTDASLAILQEYEKKDCRIQIIDKPNGGLSSARNTGIRVAHGKFLMFLDSDDYLAPNACEKIWLQSLAAPTDIVIFSTELIPGVPRASNWYYHVLSITPKRYNAFSPPVLFQERGAMPFACRQSFRKEFLDAHDLFFDETVRFGEDTVFQMECFPHAQNFCFIEDYLYCYRWYREGSLMSSVRDNMDDKIEKHQFIVETVTSYWEKQGWLELYPVEYVNWALEFLVPNIRNKEVKKARYHLEKLYAHLKQYGLLMYLDSVPKTSRALVRTLIRGR